MEFGCAYFHVSRSAYYAWLSGKLSKRGKENQQIAEKVEQIHMQHPDKGYRRIRDDLEHDFGINVNDKRILRICRAKKIKSTIKYSSHGCTRNASNPQYVAENVLNRDFHAPKPNEKWLTDVTEFKWYEGVEVHKIYLSAILIDNGPMEGFCGILKRERYYGKRFTFKQELVQMIHDYIYYYNTQRVQRNLGVVTPVEKHRMAFAT